MSTSIHSRGPDGFLTPYSDAETIDQIRTIAASSRHAVAVSDLPLKTARLKLFLRTKAPGSLGPRLYWHLLVNDDIIGAGYLERDVEWEIDEEGRPGWVEQLAFIHPSAQRQGWYTLILDALEAWSGMLLYPDTQQTLPCANAWTKREAAHEEDGERFRVEAIRTSWETLPKWLPSISTTLRRWAEQLAGPSRLRPEYLKLPDVA